MKKTMKFVGYVVVFALVFLFPCIGTKTVMASEVPPDNEEDVQEGEYNGLTYLYNNDKVVITGYVGDEPDIVIPETIHGIAVTDIAENAFSGNNKIAKITINAPVQSIPASCCESTFITSISIPDTVKVIENRAFSACYSLREIHLPDNLEKIGAEAFEYSAIQEIVIPDTVKVIDTFAFAECNSLTKIHLPKNLETLGQGVFRETGIQELVIPETVKEMSELAFERCFHLKHLSILGNPISFAECDK